MKTFVSGCILLALAILLNGQSAGAANLGVVYDFEQLSAWSTVTSTNTTLATSLDTAIKQEGRSSAKLAYAFNSSADHWGYIKRDISSDIRQLGSQTVNSISFWLYSPAAQPNLRVWFKLAESNGAEYESNGWWLSGNQYQISNAGWQKIVIPLNQMVLAGYSSDSSPGLQVNNIQFAEIGLDDPSGTIMSNTVNVDELSFNVAQTQLAYPLDSLDSWSVTTGASSTLALSTDGYNAMEGNAAIKMQYSFTSPSVHWAYMKKDVSGDLAAADPTKIDRLTFWVYSPVSQPNLRVWLKLVQANGSEYESNGWWLSGNQYQINYTGWRKIVIPLSEMTLASYSTDPNNGLVKNAIKYLEFGVDDPSGAAISGSVNVDDFKFSAADASYSIQTFSDNSTAGSVAKDTKYEATFTSNKSFTNPDDPDLVEMTAVITSPSGNTVSQPGFWYQGYTRALVSGTEQLTASAGSNSWKIRYSPKEFGVYSYYVEIFDKTTNKYMRYPTNGTSLTFTSSSTSAAKGFLKVSSADSAFLEYDNGDPFIGIGHNLLGWEWNGATGTSYSNIKGTYDYDSWIASLKTNQANMVQYGFGEGNETEWTYNASELPYSSSWQGLTKYNQQTAWKMDYRISQSESNGIFYRLNLSHWEDFDNGSGTTFNNPVGVGWGWNRNPYNSVNGGPVVTVGDFFVNRSSINTYKKYERNIIARYGYSKNLLTYEIWNEIDNAYFAGSSYSAMAEKIKDWHQEMAIYLKQMDPQKHLVTTSFADSTLGGSIWALPEIDLTTIHRYSYYNAWYPGGFAQYATEPLLNYLINDRRTSVAKPVIVGEFALSPAGDIQRNNDPTGIAFHNQLWASVMAKSVGTAMHWTWGSYLDANNLYFHYNALAAFLTGVDVRGYTQINNYSSSGSAIQYAGLTNPQHAYVWVMDRHHTFIEKQTNTISGQTLSIPGVDNATFTVKFYDTYTGSVLSTTTVTSSGNVLTVSLPTFTKDIAVKAVKN